MENFREVLPWVIFVIEYLFDKYNWGLVRGLAKEKMKDFEV